MNLAVFLAYLGSTLFVILGDAIVKGDQHKKEFQGMATFSVIFVAMLILLLFVETGLAR